jgi:hypothetical protein
MKAVDINTRLIDHYFELLKNFNTISKLDLISKLTQSTKSDLGNKKNAFDEACGAWDDNDTAGDLVSSIREARCFNRNIEKF